MTFNKQFFLVKQIFCLIIFYFEINFNILKLISKEKIMKQKDVLTKNNDLLNVMFRGTPCKFIIVFFIPYQIYLYLLFSSYTLLLLQLLRKISLLKELSLCHKLRFSNHYTLATQCHRPYIFQTVRIMIDQII